MHLLQNLNLRAERKTPRPKRIRLHPAWEFSILRDNRGVLHSIYGEIITIPDHDADLLSALNRLKAAKDMAIKDLLNSSDQGGERNAVLERKIRFLVSQGVIETFGDMAGNTTKLSESELDRFQAIIDVFSQLGGEASSKITYFNRLRKARIGLIGLGGVGSICAMMFTATGVGFLRLVDGDHIEDTNLTRQLFYTCDDVGGETKVQVLGRQIRDRGPYTIVDECSWFVQKPEAAEKAVESLDMVILTADQPRVILHRWVNEACVRNRIPLIYTFVDRVGPFYIPGRSACFGCLEQHWRRELDDINYDEIVSSLSSESPSGFPSFVAGPIQCAHAIFMDSIGLLTQAWPVSTENRMLIFNFPEHEKITINQDSDCPVCRKIRSSNHDSN